MPPSEIVSDAPQKPDGKSSAEPSAAKATTPRSASSPKETAPDAQSDEGAAASTRASGGRRFMRIGLIALQFVVAVAFIAGAISVARYMAATKPTLDRQAASEPTYAIAAVTAELETLQPSFQVFGAVEARRQVELRALVAGEVVDVHPNLTVGGRISAGERLIQIDPFSYEGALVEAQANLAEARAQLVENEARLANEITALVRADEQLALAQTDLERAEGLVARGVTTQRDVDDRRVTLSQRQQAQEAAANAIVTRQAQIDRLRASLLRLEWRVSQAERDLSDTELLAPFNAVVRTENMEVGRRLGVNDVVAALYEAEAFDIRFTVSDRQFGRLQSEADGVFGREAAASWAIGDQPVEASARVDRIGADVSATRGGVELIARVDPGAQGAAQLKPGAVVTVTMPDRTYENAARVPETALFDGAFVFIVERDADGAERLTRRPVQLLAWQDDDVIIRAETPGWLDGASIMTTRLAEAGDGVRVRRIDPRAD